MFELILSSFESIGPLIILRSIHLRNEFNFWKFHGMMITSGLLQSKGSPKGFTFGRAKKLAKSRLFKAEPLPISKM